MNFVVRSVLPTFLRGLPVLSRSSHPMLLYSAVESGMTDGRDSPLRQAALFAQRNLSQPSIWGNLVPRIVTVSN
jgi:hypothetical protein